MMCMLQLWLFRQSEMRFLAEQKGAVIQYLDVNSAFLNGYFSEEDAVYIRPPHNLDLGLEQGEAIQLHKALYGWKRAPKILGMIFREAVRELHLRQLKSEEFFYYSL